MKIHRKQLLLGMRVEWGEVSGYYQGGGTGEVNGELRFGICLLVGGGRAQQRKKGNCQQFCP